MQTELAQGAAVALATVVDVQGAVPAQVGFKPLARRDGTWVGNVGGGALEQRVRQDAAAALADDRPRLAHYRLTESGEDAPGMLCCGEVTVFTEPFLPRPTLLIVGRGHIGRPLAELGRTVGYDVQVVNVRPDRGDRPQFDPAAIADATYVVLITEDHVTDEAALRQGGGERAGDAHGPRTGREPSRGRDCPRHAGGVAMRLVLERPCKDVWRPKRALVGGSPHAGLPLKEIAEQWFSVREESVEGGRGTQTREGGCGVGELVGRLVRLPANRRRSSAGTSWALGRERAGIWVGKT